MSLDYKNLPQHVAIIMDGNGRWAKQRNLPRIAGHRQGSEVVEEIVEACRELGIPYLTLYAFSMENWARPKNEIDALMALLREFLVMKRPKLIKNEIRLETIGDESRLPNSVLNELNETKRQTAHLNRMTLVLALSYGARDEITRAINQLLREKEQGTLKDDFISVEQLGQYLDTRSLPDPDLLIRTSGESRISNFLLWQVAYSELIFTETLWPDFHKEDFLKTLEDYQRRERRFGQTSDQLRAS